MTCTFISIPGGGTAIICGPKPRRRKCSVCGDMVGHASQRECDWKMGAGATCDRLICSACTSVPAPGKDLCPTHARKWQEMRPK